MDFLLNLSEEALTITMGLLGSAICVLHFVSVLTKGNIAKISQYVNIGLHIVLFCVLMLSQIAIDVGVAVFMSSAFLYTLVSFVKYEWDKRHEKDTDGKEEGHDL